MDDNSVCYSERSEALIDEAKAHGLQLSRRQLAEWHRAGLLPRPKKQGLGQGQGSASLYPAGTAKQALACIEEFKRDRNAEIVGWRLWLRRFAVADEYWQRPIERAQNNVRLVAEQIKKIVDDDILASEALDKRIGEFTSKRELPKPFGAIRRRLKSDRFLELFQVVLPAIAGDFTNSASYSEEDSLARLFHNLLWGGHSVETEDPSPHLGISAVSLIRQIEIMSDFVLQKGKLPHEVEFTPSTLEIARDEFVQLVEIFKLLRNAEAMEIGNKTLKLDIVVQLFSLASISTEAAFILAWAYFREIPGWVDRLHSIVAEIAGALPEHDRI